MDSNPNLPSDPQEREEIMREAIQIAERLYAERKSAKAQGSEGKSATENDAIPSSTTGQSSTIENSEKLEGQHFAFSEDSRPPAYPPPPYECLPGVSFFPSEARFLQAHSGCVYGMVLAGDRLVTVSRDQTIRVWSLETGGLIYAPLRGHTASALCVAASPAHDLLISGGADNFLIFWRLSTGAMLHKAENLNLMSVLNLALTSRYLAASFKDKAVLVWDMPSITAPVPPGFTLQEVARLRHNTAVNGVLIHKDNTYVVSASGDRTIKIWETSSWNCVRTISGHTKGIACLAFSLDYTRLISGSSDETIRIWDLSTGTERACLAGHSNLVRSLAVARDMSGEEIIVSGSYDESVVVWRKEKGGDDGSEGETWVTKRFDVKTVFKQIGTGRVGELETRMQIRVFKVLCDGQKVYCATQRNCVVVWEL